MNVSSTYCQKNEQCPKDGMGRTPSVMAVHRYCWRMGAGQNQELCAEAEQKERDQLANPNHMWTLAKKGTHAVSAPRRTQGTLYGIGEAVPMNHGSQYTCR